MTKKHWRDRYDARRVTVENGLHAIYPHVMNKRTDAEVYVTMEFDITEALQHIAEKNRRDPDYRTTFYHCALMTVAKTIHLRPLLNRYVSGRFFFERNAISLGFTAKKSFEDHGEATLVVAETKDDWTLTTITHSIVDRMRNVRADEKPMGANKLANVLSHIPRFLLMFIVGVIRVLDFFGLVPPALRKDDPNFASVVVANLGSIRCPAVYHHLNNYGTNSLMVTIGTIGQKLQTDADGNQTVRDVVDVGFTLDERIADGFYFGRSLKLAQYLLSNPELLERPLSEEVDYE